MAIRPIELQLRVTGTSNVTSAFDTVTNKGKAMANSLGSATDKIKGSFDSAATSAKNLSGSLEKVRNAGAGLAAVGAGGIVLSNALVKVYQEGAKADEMLTAMMKKRGETGRIDEINAALSKLAIDAALPDDDELKRAAAGLLGFGLSAKQVEQILPGAIGQARLYGQSIESVTMSLGKAMASGKAGALTRIGLTLDPADLDRIKDATEGVERQRVMFDVVKASMDKYALSVTEGMSESEIAANRFALQMDNAQTNIGKGAANAQKFVQDLGARLLLLGNAAPSTQETAGAVLAIGSYAATSVGSVVSLGAQLGIITQSFPALGAAGATAFATIAAAAQAALPWILAIGAGIAAGTAIGNSEGWKRITNLPAYNAKWAELNKRMNDPNASKDFKARTLEEAAGDFAATGLTSDVDLVKAKYKELTGKDMADPATAKASKAADEMMAKLKSIVPSSGGASPMAMGLSLNADTALDTDTDTDSETSTGTGKKRGRKSNEAAKALRALEKVRKASERASVREAKARARAMAKAQKETEKALDEATDAQAEIQMAELNAATDERIAALEKGKGNEMAIARLRAAKEMQEAQIRAQAADSPTERNKILRLGEISSGHILRMAEIASQQSNVFSVLGGRKYYPRGSSMNSALGSPDLFLGGGGGGPRRFQLPISAKSQSMNANNQTVIEVVGRLVIDGAGRQLMRNVQALPLAPGF